MKSLLKKLTHAPVRNTAHPQAISLDRYPEDVLLYMASHFPPTTLRNLRLVCRFLGSTFAPLMLRNIKFMCPQYINRHPKRIEDLYNLYTSHLPNLSIYAKNLKVRLDRAIPLKYLPGMWQSLHRLHALKSLRLIWEAGEEVEGYVHDVVNAILEATDGKLERLILQPPERSNIFPEALTKIRGLTSLTIERDQLGLNCASSTYPCNCLPLPMEVSITPILLANPQIEELVMIHGCHRNNVKPIDLFSSEYPKFKSLTVHGLSFPSPPTTRIQPTHLRNLYNLQILTSYRQSNLDPLWALLKASHTHLESLITKQVSPILVDYLSSFPGLHVLELRDLEGGQTNSRKEVAESFITTVLPRHAPTLRQLGIRFLANVALLPGWTFDLTRSEWSSTLPALTSLRSLAIHPPVISSKNNPNNPGPAESSSSSSTSIELGHGTAAGGEGDVTAIISAYQLVIDKTQTLPNLEELTFYQPTQQPPNSTPEYTKWKDQAIKSLREAIPMLKGTTGRPYRVFSFHGSSTVTRRDVVTESESESGGDYERFGWTIPTLQLEPFVASYKGGVF